MAIHVWIMTTHCSVLIFSRKEFVKPVVRQVESELCQCLTHIEDVHTIPVARCHFVADITLQLSIHFTLLHTHFLKFCQWLVNLD